MDDEEQDNGALPPVGEPPSARIAANKNRALQAADPGSRRKLFDAPRKAVFLEWFAATASLSWSARRAGVHYRTVLRHKMDDPEFGAAYDLAEAQAVPRLRAWLAEVKAEAARRMAEAVEREEDEADALANDDSPEDIGPARMSVEQAMQFLRDYEAMEARRARTRAREAGASTGSGQAGRGRPVSVASNEEVRVALVRALRAHGIRVRNGEGDAPPSTTAFGGPRLSSQPVPPSGMPPACRAATPPPRPGEDL